MTHQERTREQLVRELETLQERNAALEGLHKEHASAEEAWQTQRRLLSELLSLQERERRSLAYDIHDGLAQQLAGALQYYEAFHAMTTFGSPTAENAFNLGTSLLRQAMAETRGLVSGLRPPVLDESGIAAAVGRLARESEQQGGPRIDFHHRLEQSQFPPLLERTVFRIVQEGLTNARRHSRSETVRLELVQEGHRVRILIQDWGIGFDPTKVETSRAGLEGIRERARFLGGQAAIHSAPGAGTRIVVEMPIRDNGIHETKRS